MKQALLTGILASTLALAAACVPNQTPTPEKIGLPNPASVFCKQNGGQLDLRTGPDGGVSGICMFPDGSECDEWAYFRSECAPGDSLETGRVQPPAASMDDAVQAWQTYQDPILGYTFSYPPEAAVETNADPAHSISVIGPEFNGDRWPQITISHPTDLPEFRPPEGADLEQWLTDHSMMGDTRMPDVEIGGAASVHLRHERSPQSYAYDRYYFARAGQLYMIVIGHAGDREDWNLYNRFLDSFHFE